MTGRRTGRVRRRNRLSSREELLTWCVAGASFLAALFAGCHPTRTPVVDQLLTGLLAGGVTWLAATAPWWAIAVAAGGLALVDLDPWRTPVAVVAAMAMFVVGSRRTSWAVVRAAAAALCVHVALRLQIDHPFGRSALVAAAAFALIGIAGFTRRGRRIRRRILWGALIASGAAVLALVLAGAGALAARHDLQRGVDEARSGLSALRSGDPDAAAQHLDAAAQALGRARHAVDGPWAWPARAVPVLSQHVRAATSLVDSARQAARTVSTAVGGVDLESVRVHAGAIDLQALASLASPLDTSLAAVADLDDTVADARSGWLLAPLEHRLSDLAEETASAREQAANAVEVTQLAPRLLGRDGRRVWLILFTTPSEARGLGGFPGNFAELTVDGGVISVTRFGRSIDLINGGPNPDGRTITGPADYLARYGDIGAGGNGLPMKRLFWNNVTLSPDLPSVAQVVAEIYPQSGGTAIDGVIVADPYALQGIVQLTGPLTVEGKDGPLTATDTASFLLRDQYQAFPGANNERKDALASAALQATQALLTRDLPSPAIIARALGEPSREGHLMIWSLHPEDQDPLRRLGVSGELPHPDPDGFAYTVNNSGPNKLDAYLTRSLTYDGVVDRGNGHVGATATIRLRNGLPTPITLPPDVISNEKGLPPGTNRVWLSVYSPLQLVDARLDGQPVALTAATERGWNVYTAYVNLAPGQEAALVIELGGTLDLRHGYGLTIRPQPLAADNPVDADVRDVHGARLVHYSGPLDVVTTLDQLT